VKGIPDVVSRGRPRSVVRFRPTVLAPQRHHLFRRSRIDDALDQAGQRCKRVPILFDVFEPVVDGAYALHRVA